MSQETIAERLVFVGEGKTAALNTPDTKGANYSPSILLANLMVEEPSASIAHAGN